MTWQRMPELRLAQRLTPGKADLAGKFYHTGTGVAYAGVVQFIVLQQLGRRQHTFSGEQYPTTFHEFVVLLPDTYEVVKLSFRGQSLKEGGIIDNFINDDIAKLPPWRHLFRCTAVEQVGPKGGFFSWYITHHGEAPGDVGNTAAAAAHPLQVPLTDLPQVATDVQVAGVGHVQLRALPSSRMLVSAFKEVTQTGRLQRVIAAELHRAVSRQQGDGSRVVIPSYPDFYAELASKLGISRDEAKRRHWWRLYGGGPKIDIETPMRTALWHEGNLLMQEAKQRMPQITPQWDPMPFWTQAHGRMLRSGERKPFLYSADWANLEKKFFDGLAGKSDQVSAFLKSIDNMKEKKAMKSKPNRFFVIPTSMNSWGSPDLRLGFPDLKQASAYAVERTKADGREREIFQRVRVVRRKPQPVVVERA